MSVKPSEPLAVTGALGAGDIGILGEGAADRRRMVEHRRVVYTVKRDGDVLGGLTAVIVRDGDGEDLMDGILGAQRPEIRVAVEDREIASPAMPFYAAMGRVLGLRWLVSPPRAARVPPSRSVDTNEMLDTKWKFVEVGVVEIHGAGGDLLASGTASPIRHRAASRCRHRAKSNCSRDVGLAGSPLTTNWY